jgi:hypothetical protein
MSKWRQAALEESKRSLLIQEKEKVFREREDMSYFSKPLPLKDLPISPIEHFNRTVNELRKANGINK